LLLVLPNIVILACLPPSRQAKGKVKVKVKTKSKAKANANAILRLAVYRRSVRPGSEPLENQGQNSFLN
jgi:hypothetical protein